MSDKYIQLSNFKYGLDTRRSELTSLPGTLMTCVNAFINAGGEIEKRKAFIKATNLFPTNTFGLQDTDTGLMTFGSDAAPNASLPTGVTYQRLLPAFVSVPQDFESLSLAGTPAVNGSYIHDGTSAGKSFYSKSATESIFWTGVQWRITSSGVIVYFSTQNVARPDLVTVWQLGTGVAPAPTFVYTPATLVQMTKVVFSSNFLGKAFVIAEFGNPSGQTFTFCFYNGTVVASSRNGLVLLQNDGITVETPTNLSTDLATQINAVEGWLGFDNKVPLYDTSGKVIPPTSSSYNHAALAGSTLLYTPPGIHITPVPSVVSTAGTLGAALLDQNFGGSPAVAANAAVNFNAGTTGTIVVTAPATAAGTGTAALSGTITWATSLAATITAVASAINSRTFIHGYTAAANGTSLTVYAPISFGVFTFNLTVVTTGDITVGGAVAPPTDVFKLILTPSNILVQGNQTVFKSSISAAVKANSTTPSFMWEIVDNTVNMTILSDFVKPIGSAAFGTNFVTATFYVRGLPAGSGVTAFFRCTAKDGAPTAAAPPALTNSQDFQVTFKHTT